MLHLSSLRSWSGRAQVALFFALTFGLSWSLWIPAALASSPAEVPAVWGLGSFGPSVAGVVMVGLCHGSAGLQNLGRRLVRWRVRLRWYALALGFPFAMAAGVVLLDQALRGVPLTLAPLIPAAQIPVILFVVLVLGGPLNEELGWRGFALPVLQQQHSPLRASLLLGIGWAIWHLPLFWIPGASQAGLPVAPILAQIVALSVLFTWLYNRTRGSLLLALLFHAALNGTGAVLPLLPDATGSTQAMLLTVAATIGTAALVALHPAGLDRGPSQTDLT